MSKMREAFNALPIERFPKNSENFRAGFEAGYQAAIADVKAGVAVCIGYEFLDGKSGPVIWIDGYPSVGEKLYRIPEDV